MQGDNALVEKLFSMMADLLEIRGDNPFKIRAYRNASRVVHALPGEAADLLGRGEVLSGYVGIGKDLAKKIEEIVTTGHLQVLDSLMHDVSPELLQLMKITGLGGKRVALLHEKLGIVSLDDLEKAANDHSIRTIRGFGKRIENAILDGIKDLKGYNGRITLADMEQHVHKIIRYLCNDNPNIINAVVAGSFRRQLETIGDIDLLVSCRDEEELVKKFLSFENINVVTVHGIKKITVILQDDIQVDLRLIDAKSYGAALHYFTGSKAHNIAIRLRAVHSGLKINEYGIFRGDRKVGGQHESEVFEFLHMPYIEPELRENNGEIEAAEEGRLPNLIKLSDIKGDLHMHTTSTDGHNSAEEMILAAREKGYEYVAITDHSKRIAMAHGLTEYDLELQIEYIDRIASKIAGIKVLKGIEVDILEDGSLDLADSVLSKLDIRICSVHSRFNLSKEQQTKRILRAMENRHFNILAHPTGRLINRRAPLSFNMEKIMQAAHDRHCYLEVNSYPDRLDMNGSLCRIAKEFKVKVVINTDSHSTHDLDYLRYGIGQARRGWLEKDDVINTRDFGALLRLLQR